MNRQDIRMQVAAAVESSWSDFSKDHPALAQVLDQELLNIVVIESLARDAKFLQAYEVAIAAGLGAQTVSETISRFVEIVLKRLR